MLLKTNFFGFKSSLNASLTTDNLNLPIVAQDYTKLLGGLPNNGDYTFLSICDGQSKELVKVTNNLGVLGLTRAQDGTPLSSFAKGAVVRFTFDSPSLIKDYLCQTPCCDTECHEPAKVVGQEIFNKKVNENFTTTFVFTGTTPLAPAISLLPAWLNVTAQSTNFITVSGTPLLAGTYVFSVAVANSKPSVDNKQIIIHVTT